MKPLESTAEILRLGNLTLMTFPSCRNNSPCTQYLLKNVYLDSKLKIPKVLNNLVGIQIRVKLITLLQIRVLLCTSAGFDIGVGTPWVTLPNAHYICVQYMHSDERINTAEVNFIKTLSNVADDTKFICLVSDS